ncbi:MAG: hypothetical protein IT436_13770 [Phycisphaerales bacterium]|nr:hypothetical protein [Phycisphaerales bacterium]
MDHGPEAQRGTAGPEGPAGAAPGAATTIAGVAGALAGVRSRARFRLCVLAGAWLLTAVLAVGLGLVLFDYLARLPAVLRGVLLAIGVCAGVWEFRRAVLPALRFRPSLTEVALRLESSEAGRRAGLAGVLAAGLELGSTSGAAGGGVLERKLSARVADEAMRRFDPSIAASVFAPGRVRAATLVLAGAAAVIGVWGAARPELARIGVTRLVAPWMGVQWPRRTEVVNATGAAAHAIDAALPLRAMLTRTDRGPGRTDVWVNYRIVRDGEPGPVQRTLMTAQQQRAASVIATASELGGRSIPVTGEMYERLVEPAGLLGADAPVAGGAGREESAGPPELEYWFQTSDDRTEPARIALVERPGVSAAAVEVVPPAYAAGARSGESWWTGERVVAMGERGAAVGPILAGSTVRLRLELNKPVPAAPAWRDDEAGAEEPSITGDGARWVMEWTAGVSRRLSVGLEDSYGLRSADEVVFSVDVLADQSPGATVVDPARDESVLATAVIDVVGEGRDDIGLVWVALERERIAAAPSPAPADGAAADPKAGPAEMARLEVAAQGEDSRQARVTGVLDLSELGVKAGDEVRVTTVARDIFADESGAGGHEPVRSTPRRLRIITESELVEQLQSELAGVRQSAIRLDREQSQAAETLERAGAEGASSPELRRRQWSIGEALRPQSAALQRLAARAERNGLQDRNLELMLESAAAIVARAGEASDRATSAMDRAGQRPSEAAEAAKEAGGAQREVREELARLIDLLESGKDGWAVRRAIEKLLAEQKELSQRTDELGAETVGRPMSELTPGQRDELNRLAQQQREASAKAGAAMDQILSRARQMAENDPAQAEAMMQAAKRAQERGLQESMEQAAEEIARNKTQSGSDYQEQAEEALSQMLEEMENTDTKREEVLRRVLTGLIRSIEELVKRQQGDLEAIGRVEKVGVEALARSMIDLRVRTLAVAEEARGAGREAIKVIAALAAAGDAQTTAIGALRASPADTGGADASERVSLEALKEALAQAKKLEEQSQEREQARKRDELRQAYTQALLTQRDLRLKASDFASKELNRRDRAVLRGLGERQEAQRAGLEELRAKSEELKEAGVFQFAHKRLDDLLKRIGATLSGGEMNAATAAGLSDSERMLESLVEALKEDEKKNDFNEGSDGGGGGGGGGGQGGQAPPAIPPIAELKLLKLIQQEIAGRTRAAGDTEVIEKLGLDQQELTRYAKELIERMKKQERDQGAGGGP